MDIGFSHILSSLFFVTHVMGIMPNHVEVLRVCTGTGTQSTCSQPKTVFPIEALFTYSN